MGSMIWKQDISTHISSSTTFRQFQQGIHHCGSHVGTALPATVGDEGNGVSGGFAQKFFLAFFSSDESDRQSNHQIWTKLFFPHQSQQFEKSRRGIADDENPIAGIGCSLAQGKNGACYPET